MKKTLNKMLCVRVSCDLLRKFNTIASSYGKPSEIHRQLIEAFVENRIVIIPTHNSHTSEF